MRVTVNDAEVELDEPATVSGLLTRLGFPDRGVAVAVNRVVRPRSEWDSPVPPDAHVEVVTAVQGG